MNRHKSAGATRLLSAARNTSRGFVDTLRTEAAFRQELMLATLLCALIFVLDIEPTWRVMLLLTLGLVLIVELLNTAIEATVDRVGLEHHPLSGKAKDAGSAAVGGSLFLHGITWACVPW